jgi:hypothetical protein
MYSVKGEKRKIHPRTGHEGPMGEYRYSSLLSLTSALNGGGLLMPRPGRFTPGKETRYPLYRRPSGSQGGQNGCGKSLPYRVSFNSLVLSLYVIRTYFSFLIVLHFAFCLCCTTHTKHKHPCPRWDSNPQTLALDRSAIAIGNTAHY